MQNNPLKDAMDSVAIDPEFKERLDSTVLTAARQANISERRLERAHRNTASAADFHEDDEDSGFCEVREHTEPLRYNLLRAALAVSAVAAVVFCAIFIPLMVMNRADNNLPPAVQSVSFGLDRTVPEAGAVYCAYNIDKNVYNVGDDISLTFYFGTDPLLNPGDGAYTMVLYFANEVAGASEQWTVDSGQDRGQGSGVRGQGSKDESPLSRTTNHESRTTGLASDDISIKDGYVIIKEIPDFFAEQAALRLTAAAGSQAYVFPFTENLTIPQSLLVGKNGTVEIHAELFKAGGDGDIIFGTGVKINYSVSGNRITISHGGKISVTPPEIKMPLTFPSVLEDFKPEDFDAEFFKHNTLILVPFEWPHLLYDNLNFYTAYVQDGKLNFLIDIPKPDFGGDAAIDSRLFAVVIPNEVFGQYELGTAWDFSRHADFKPGFDVEAFYLMVENNSVPHRVGYLAANYTPADKSHWLPQAPRMTAITSVAQLTGGETTKTVSQGTYLTDDDIGSLYLTLYDDNRFFFVHSGVSWFMPENGSYVAENGQLILYHFFDESEEYARFDIGQGKLIFVAGNGFAVRGMPSGAVFRFAGSGQGTEPEDPEQFSTALVDEAREAFLQAFGFDPGRGYFSTYYGTYDGASVFFRPKTAAVNKIREISGVTFGYSSDWQILVYKDGVFYDLEDIEAIFTAAVLTQSQLEQIAVTHTERRNASVIIADYYRIFGDDTIALDDVYVYRHYGRYTGAAYTSVAVVMAVHGTGLWAVSKNVTVAGFEFLFSYMQHEIIIWNALDHAFYTLPEAYDAGLLSIDDIAAIHALYTVGG
ncbi:MAG: hypothetical protein FWD58_06340 [Firmicutes bacterium]|nr:hypothetical protein [Bacillota bacterium]